MIKKLHDALRDFVDSVAPSPETRIRQELEAVQHACCQLLLEVARLEAVNAEQKHDVVSRVMGEQFGMPTAELVALIDIAGRLENRPTSYFDSVRLINAHFDAPRKAGFIEQLWRVAMVDGDIDMYEDHLVRKLSDLLHVSHNDFILAKNRVRALAAG